MASLIDTLVPSSTYNALPHIRDVSGVPEANSRDLEDLRSLLIKHHVPENVSIRLIHKHFEAQEGEVMVIRDIKLPTYGTAQIMQPVMSSNGLHGIHYFVNEQGSLQAYEYAECPQPSSAGLEPFFDDFCALVAKRGLQRKFGLKFMRSNEQDRAGWTEFELHERRSTVMLQHGMPMPNGDFDFSVSTEWDANITDSDGRDCSHKTVCRHGKTTCRHCKHCKAHDGVEEGVVDDGCDWQGLYLGGQKIEEGTPLHDMVTQLLVAF